MFREQGSGAAGRSVSAADVVLFGVNIILPLMSQDLLKVRPRAQSQYLNNASSLLEVITDVHSVTVLQTVVKLVCLCFQFPSLCNQYYKLITFICEIFPEKIPQLPEELFKSLMYSLELGMTSMSSEVSQLCLEALSPLAEQCAKTQEKDTPLFIATRHFLKVRHPLLGFPPNYKVCFIPLCSESGNVL